MRKTVFVLALVLLFVVAFGFAQSTDKADVGAKIKQIASYLEKPGGPGSDGKIMFALLLEAILQVAPQTGFPPEFVENMQKAKEIADSMSLFDPDGVIYLHKAYRLANSNQDFQMPGSIKEIQDAVNYGRMVLATAAKKLRIGQPDECAKGLLEAAVMIVTPMYR